ncbi:MAG: hypothetical protein PUD72_02655 [Oscillospiraceae bacterium]|nr:hypothetical protein [Oscillospiraceae bacterium]
MANYIGSILSSYTASSLMSNISAPNYMNNASSQKTGLAAYQSNFATIANDYKALKTKNYDALSSSYSYLKEVTSSEYATESQTSTDKAENADAQKEITLSANQLSMVYGKYASNARFLDMYV